jgi:hypothetical protein
MYTAVIRSDPTIHIGKSGLGCHFCTAEREEKCRDTWWLGWVLVSSKGPDEDLWQLGIVRRQSP